MSFAGAAGIQLAKKDGVQWILHIDTDELMYPGGSPEFSLQHLLGSQESDVDTLVFPNYESLPERDDVHDPFTEVRHGHVIAEQQFCCCCRSGCMRMKQNAW